MNLFKIFWNALTTRFHKTKTTVATAASLAVNNVEAKGAAIVSGVAQSVLNVEQSANSVVETATTEVKTIENEATAEVKSVEDTVKADAVQAADKVAGN